VSFVVLREFVIQSIVLHFSECAVGHTFEAVSYEVFGACIEVQRQLGPHCMEVDYQRALQLALSKRSQLEFLREAEIPIVFDGVEITRCRVDFVVWDAVATVLLEIKAAKAIRPEDFEQCLLFCAMGISESAC
jgi:GxxExxY protein